MSKRLNKEKRELAIKQSKSDFEFLQYIDKKFFFFLDNCVFEFMITQ